MKLLIAILALSVVASADKAVLFCYYGSWATYRAWPGTLKVDSLDVSKCSHAVYAFAGLDATTLGVVSLDPYNDLEENWGLGSYKKFSALAAKNPGLTTLLAVGGWNEGSGKFSTMAASASQRRRFATLAADFVQLYGFGGLDLDWEYPGRRDGDPQDKENFALLVEQLKSVFSKRGLVLSAAVGADPSMLLDSYDAVAIAKHADYINLMTFDFTTAADSPTTQPHAALNSAAGRLSVEAAVDAWVSAGAAPSKLVVGIPLYARTYTLADPTKSSGVGAPATGPGKAGPVTGEPGYLAYYEVCMAQEDEGWQVKRDGDVVYAVGGNQWAVYDDAKAVEEKGRWAVERGLGGAFAWALEGDDNLDTCGGGAGPLLRALAKGLGR